jgi:hypothetical protein
VLSVPIAKTRLFCPSTIPLEPEVVNPLSDIQSSLSRSLN